MNAYRHALQIAGAGDMPLKEHSGLLDHRKLPEIKTVRWLDLSFPLKIAQGGASPLGAYE